MQDHNAILPENHATFPVMALAIKGNPSHFPGLLKVGMSSNRLGQIMITWYSIACNMHSEPSL